MIQYNPNNWYWEIRGDDTQVFSSTSGTFVAITDPTYLASGILATVIASIPELYDVLVTQAPAAAVLAQSTLLPDLLPGQQLKVYTKLGLTITSTGSPDVDGTYALDSVTLDQIGSVARDASSGLGLPGGLTTFIYPDITGTPHSMTSTNVVDVYKEMRNYIFALNTTAQTLENGGSAAWPASSVTIA